MHHTRFQTNKAKNNIDKLLSEFSLNVKGTSVFNHPFLIPCNDKKINITNSNSVILNKMSEIADKYNLPLEFNILYSSIEDMDSEISNNHITFLSLNKILSNEKHFQSNNNTFIDIAIKYAGLGYIYVLAYDTIYKKTFIRLDGGLNGYDVKFNNDYYSGLVKRNDRYFDVYNQSDKLFDFINGIKKMKLVNIDDESYDEIVVM